MAKNKKAAGKAAVAGKGRGRKAKAAPKGDRHAAALKAWATRRAAKAEASA